MALKTTDDPRLLPAYSVAEAAHYLRVPPGTLRSWVVGRLYPVAGESKRSKALIHLADPQKRYLSFLNLVEAHVLAGIRRRYGVKLPKVAMPSTICSGAFASTTHSSTKLSRRMVLTCSWNGMATW